MDNLEKQLKETHSLYEYNYLDFYYKNDWEKELEYILNSNDNFFFKSKPKILIIKEVEVISFKKIINTFGSIINLI